MKTLIKPISLLGLIALVLPLSAQTSDFPSWTASDGRVIQARFISLEGESVVIEKDGASFALALAKLAPESGRAGEEAGGRSRCRGG